MDSNPVNNQNGETSPLQQEPQQPPAPEPTASQDPHGPGAVHSPTSTHGVPQQSEAQPQPAMTQPTVPQAEPHVQQQQTHPSEPTAPQTSHNMNNSSSAVSYSSNPFTAVARGLGKALSVNPLTSVLVGMVGILLIFPYLFVIGLAFISPIAAMIGGLVIGILLIIIPFCFNIFYRLSYLDFLVEIRFSSRSEQVLLLG